MQVAELKVNSGIMNYVCHMSLSDNRIIRFIFIFMQGAELKVKSGIMNEVRSYVTISQSDCMIRLLVPSKVQSYCTRVGS